MGLKPKRCDTLAGEKYVLMKTVKLLFIGAFLLQLLPACAGFLPSNEDTGKTDIADSLATSRPSIYRDGTVEHPFDPGDFATGSEVAQYYSGSGEEVWVEGYIVGYVNGSRMSAIAYEAGEKASNIVLGDSKKSPSRLMPVQLSTSSAASKDARNALNLCDNPSNLGRLVIICGSPDSYMSTTGLKPATAYQWVE